MLRGFYGTAEDALTRLRGWEQLTPPIDVVRRRRAELIDDDLMSLGAAPMYAPPGPQAVAYELDTMADGLGYLYVLEGSALGGRIVARRARNALGDDLPVAFFSGTGREDLRGDWTSLLGALNTFGAHQPIDVRSAVVAAAQRAFASLGARLTAPRAVP